MGESFHENLYSNAKIKTKMFITKKDCYYMGIAKEVSEESKCLSRKIGAVLVKHDAIISTGYNGPPRGVEHCQHHEIVDGKLILGTSKNTDTCPRQRSGFISGTGMEFCIAGHAEENAIVQAARIGIATIGSTMYCYCGMPCVKCVIKIINAGILKVYCLKSKVKIKSGYDNNLSEQLLGKAGVEFHYMEFEQ